MGFLGRGKRTPEQDYVGRMMFNADTGVMTDEQKKHYGVYQRTGVMPDQYTWEGARHTSKFKPEPMAPGSKTMSVRTTEPVTKIYYTDGRPSVEVSRGAASNTADGALGFEDALGGPSSLYPNENPFTAENHHKDWGTAVSKPVSQPQLSFGEAFADARRQGLDVFDWNGNSYHTKTKEELDAERALEQSVSQSISPPMSRPVQQLVDVPSPPFPSSYYNEPMQPSPMPPAPTVQNDRASSPAGEKSGFNWQSLMPLLMMAGLGGMGGKETGGMMMVPLMMMMMGGGFGGKSKENPEVGGLSK